MMHVAPRPAPMNDFEVHESLMADLYREITDRWTLACMVGDHMQPDEARAMALAATGDVLKERAK